MTDYELGILVGGLIGWILALLSLVLAWSLCNIARQSDDAIKIQNWKGTRYAAGRGSETDIRVD